MIGQLKRKLETTLGIEIRRKPTNGKAASQSFPSYEAALAACPGGVGYDFSRIADVVFEKTLRYRQQLTQTPAIVCSPVQSFALNSLLYAAQGKNKLSVVDFGGACGAHFFFFRQILGKRIHLDWRVVETTTMVKRSESLSEDGLHFFDSISAAKKSISSEIDLIFTSSALQYSSAPLQVLNELAQNKAPNLALLRGNVTLGFNTEFRIQRSRLSDNGPGPMVGNFVDEDIYYPITSTPKSHLEECLRSSGYLPVAFFEDDSGFHYENQISFGALYETRLP